MRKILLFVRSNLRRNKGQTIAIAVLVLIAAIMLNLWLMLATDYKSNFERWHTELNDGHVSYVIHDEAGMESDLVAAFDGDRRTSEYAITPSLAIMTNIPYNDAEDNNFCVFVKKDDALSRTVGRVKLSRDNGGSGVYLPSYYDTDAVRVGKPVTLVVGGRPVEYELCGFFNSAMNGAGTCVVVEILMTDAAYDDLAAKGCAPEAWFCSIRLKNSSHGESYLSAIEDTVGAAHPSAFAMGNFYEHVLSARYVTQGMASAIISVMAFLVLLIALIVLSSNIVNYIQEKIKNLGALKAIGYTGRQLIAAMVMQFAIITLAASLVGIALSYALFPAINSMMEVQTALPYSVRFLFLPAFLSLLIPTAAVALVVFLSSLKMIKIQPIMALRQGSDGKKTERSRVPLDRTALPVNVKLGLKTAFSGIKQSITVFLTMIVLSFIVVFAGIATENIVADSTQFVNMIAGEQTDCAATVSSADRARFVADMSADERVEKIYLYHAESMRAGNSTLQMEICDDFSKSNSNILCEGDYPVTADEVAVGIKFAKDKGLKVGGTVALTKNGVTKQFRICGLTQLANNLGRDGLITTDGYSAFGELQNYTYYIDLKKGESIDDFVDEIKTTQAYEIYLILNVRALLDNGVGGYVSLMQLLVVAVIIISMLIVTFVLYLLVRTLLANKKRDYGVLKSIGYTTGQLVLQTAISFMPAMLLSTVIGLIIGCLVMNPLLSVFLSGVGIVKCTFVVPVGMIIGLGAGLVAVSFGIACLLSLKVKKITPKALLTGE